MTVEPTIDYEALAQEAMRGVVRTVLTRTAKHGLPGDHHFYISFDTEAPGVSLSRRLKEKYPREMTIVLQHRFWDLIVSEDRFEVKLSFDSIPERLIVPFAAVKVFFDPSVRFGLQFEDAGAATGGEGRTTTGSFGTMAPRPSGNRTSSVRKSTRTARKPRGDEAAGEAGEQGDRAPTAHVHPKSVPGPVDIPPAQRGADEPADGATGGEREDAPDVQERPSGGAEIVSLDKFRKK